MDYPLDLRIVMSRVPVPLMDRILEQSEQSERPWEDGMRCWLWKGKINRRGYASFKARWPEDSRRRYMEVHRVSYELFRGPIPEGMTLDHLCRTRHCVNPYHLDPCTVGENVLRGLSSPAENARKTRCKRGHPFTPENTRIVARTGYRQCRKCDEIRNRYWNEKRKAIA